MWKTCLGTNGFAIAETMYGLSFTQDEVLRRAAELGYDGIELDQRKPGFLGLPGYPTTRREQIALLRTYASYGLRTMGLQVSGPNAVERTTRPHFVDLMRRSIDFGHAIGARTIAVYPAPRMPELPDADAVESLAATFRPLADEAGEAGILICMEPEPVQVDHTLEMAKAVAVKVGSPFFRLVYDVSHVVLLGGNRPVESLKMLWPHVGHVHFTDTDATIVGSTRHLPPGEGIVDLDAVLRGLRDVGYGEWIQIDFWGHPDPFYAAARGKEYLDRAFAALDQGADPRPRRQP